MARPAYVSFVCLGVFPDLSLEPGRPGIARGMQQLTEVLFENTVLPVGDGEIKLQVTLGVPCMLQMDVAAEQVNPGFVQEGVGHRRVDIEELAVLLTVTIAVENAGALIGAVQGQAAQLFGCQARPK